MTAWVGAKPRNAYMMQLVSDKYSWKVKRQPVVLWLWQQRETKLINLFRGLCTLCDNITKLFRRQWSQIQTWVQISALLWFTGSVTCGQLLSQLGHQFSHLQIGDNVRVFLGGLRDFIYVKYLEQCLSRCSLLLLLEELNENKKRLLSIWMRDCGCQELWEIQVKED